MSKRPTTRIWIDPKAGTVGVTAAQFKAGVIECFNIKNRVCDAPFVLVEKASQSHIQIYTKELYLGSGRHARGLYNPSSPHRLYLHSGKIAAGHHSGANGPKNQPIEFQMMTATSMQRILLHEHFHQVIQLAHSKHPECTLHTNANKGPCGYEIRYLVQRYGPPVKRSLEAVQAEEPVCHVGEVTP